MRQEPAWFIGKFSGLSYFCLGWSEAMQRKTHALNLSFVIGHLSFRPLGGHRAPVTKQFGIKLCEGLRRFSPGEVGGNALFRKHVPVLLPLFGPISASDTIPKPLGTVAVIYESASHFPNRIEVSENLSQSVSITDDWNRAITKCGDCSKAIWSKRTGQQHHVRAGEAQIADPRVALRVISKSARIFTLRHDNFRGEDRGHRSGHDQECLAGQEPVEQRNELSKAGGIIWLYWTGCDQFGPVRFKAELIEQMLAA